MVPDVWHQQDLPLLQVLVTRELQRTPDLPFPAGLDERQLSAAAQRLHSADFLTIYREGGGAWAVQTISERGLRAAGAWPNETLVSAQVLAALEEVAEQAPEAERSKLRTAAAVLAGPCRALLVDVSASLAAKSLGA
jgi:hypothetical protein